MTNGKINSDAFYGVYHGHKVRHLRTLLPYLRSSSDYLIWTAGDSSLDNKYWFEDRAPAVGAYAQVLDPPTSICDITYWLNYLALQRQEQKPNEPKVATINTAVEATTLNERWYALRSQDRFLRDNIGSEDVLVVSVGGNDVALLPTPCTILAMGGMLCLPMSFIENGITCCAVPINDCCCGCGASLVSCAGSCPPCLGYFRHMFGTRVQKYIESLTSKTKPKKILVCMIYYLDENNVPSWAGPALSAMGYDRNPAKLQLFIRKAFEEATSRIQIPGTEVIPVPLFNVLDGKRSEDYVARVEPSAIGGRKMAEFLLDIVTRPQQTTSQMSAQGAVVAPSTAIIGQRT